MKVVMVSGCYDIIHGGHIRFLEDAAALGDYLVVCVAGDDVICQHKGRAPAMPAAHRAAVLRALSCVDEVRITSAGELGMDFERDFRELVPNVLAVTEDDRYAEDKKLLCWDADADYVVLPKALDIDPISATQIRARVTAPERVPLRVDFAGGWLDVPRFAIDGACVVNCAVQPLVSLTDWPYPVGSGMGGSAAYAILRGRDPYEEDAAHGCGWQDPAVINETGLCVWQSGQRPRLEYRTDGHWLDGLLALWWTGLEHDNSVIVERDRPYETIKVAGDIASDAAHAHDIKWLATAVHTSYAAQLSEGMAPLPKAEHAVACKYCGGGYGGYALYLFAHETYRRDFVTSTDGARAIEPYCRWRNAAC